MGFETDEAKRVKKLSKGMLPPGGKGGRVLRKASDADYDAAWQPDDGGLPPGGVATDVLTKRSYVDGDAEWAPASAGSGFPVGPEDNGTETGSVEFDTFAGASFPGALVMLRIDDTTADSSYCAVFVPAFGGVGAALRSALGDVNVRSDNDDVNLIAGGSVILGARVSLGALPLSDPGVTGMAWNDSGTVKISP